MLGLQSRLTKPTARKSYDSTNSLRFVPNDDFIRIADHADFNHVSSGVSYFTVSLWFKHDDGTPTDKETLIAKYKTNGNKREWRISIDDNKKIEVHVSSDGTSTNTVASVSTFVVDDTDWHHLYFRYDGSKTDEEHRTHMVVDGVNVLGIGVGTPSASNYAALHENDADITIGCFFNDDTPSSDSVFDGRIDEVCYWDEHYHKGSSILGAEYIYNNGNPRDMRYAGGGNTSSCTLIGYWKMGEFYNGGASVPDGTFPVTTTNPLGTNTNGTYSGGANGIPLIALNYAGGSPKRTGSNLVRNGDFSTAITQCAVDQANNGVTATSGTDWEAGHDSNTGHTITNDTSVYYVGGRSIKMVTASDDNHLYLRQKSTSSIEDGEFYVYEFWWRTSTDTSDDAGQSWGRCQYELDHTIEGDAQYGLSGDGNLGTSYSTINTWHRVISVGKCNTSDAVRYITMARNIGNSNNLAKTFWFDNVSVFKLTGSHHGVAVSLALANSMMEGVDN